MPSANLHEHVFLPNTEVEILDDGGLQLVELNPIDPWLADPREPLELQEGEVKVRVLCSLHTFYTITHVNTVYFLHTSL